jgi:YD repeat-containing protein
MIYDSFNEHSMKFKLFAYINLMIFATLSCSAQIDLKTFVNTVPPNIASFQKYGNTPINYSTGQISQNINLYTLEIDANLRIPIDLLYSNSGLKPDAIPSWVGNGWDLMPGGYIMQEIRGANDLMPGGLARSPAAKQKISNYINGQITNPSDKYTYVKNVLRGIEDTQPDYFSLNLLGRSISFYLEGTTVKLVNEEPVKIELISPNGFIVTDEKGYQYHFLNATATSGTLSDDLYESPGGTTTATWGLDKIITPNNDVVSFNYISDAIYTTVNEQSTYTWGSYIKQLVPEGPYQCKIDFGGPYHSSSSASIAQSVLSSISYKGRVISFETISRNDIKIDYGAVAHALSAIKVRNERNEVIKNVQFKYNNGQRLRLDQLSIVDNAGSLPPQFYNFDYYSFNNLDVSTIPLITSPNRVRGLDYWGYYNGKDDNTQFSVTNLDYDKSFVFLSGLTSRIGKNEHNADGNFSLIGMLKKVTYPTGGYTLFEYEPNQVIYRNYKDISPFIEKNAAPPVYTDIINKAITCFDDGSSSSQGDQVGTFQVGSNPNMSVEWRFTTDDSRDQGSLKIQKVGDTQDLIDVSDKTTVGSKMLSLPAGTYQYQLHIACNFVGPNSRNEAFFAVRSFEYPTYIPVTVGGNRILSIKDFDNMGKTSSSRKVEYSNAELNSLPHYFDQYDVLSEEVMGAKWPTMTCGPVYVIGERNLFEEPGFLITYKKVTELLGDQGENGKTEYYYDNVGFIGRNYTESPYPPVVHLSWRDMDLQKKIIYRKVGSDFIKQQSTGYTFTPSPTNSFALENLKGLKFGVKGRVVQGYEIPNNYEKYFNYGSIFYPTDRHAELGIVDTLFNDNGTIIQNASSFAYTSQDFLRAAETQTNSKGKVIEKRYWYVNDYNDILNLPTLKSNHLIGLPLKQITITDGKITDGQVFTRDNKGNITQMNRYESTALQSVPTHDRNQYYLPAFNPKVQLGYDGSNHLNQYLQQDNVPVAILWGYNGTYPIAEVKNCTYQNIVNILGQQTVDRLAGDNPGTDLEVRMLLDTLFKDIRSKGAQVTTYTYNPLVGMTSQTDAKSNTTYYEYDSFQRLKTVRDQSGNVVRNYCYNYKGEQAGCPIVTQMPVKINGNSFVTNDLMDSEWKQEAPSGYSIAVDDGVTINAQGNAGTNAGRYAYFATGGSTSPLTYVNGTLSFTAKGSGTIEILLIASYNNSIVQRKTFNLTNSYQAFTWSISNLYPRQEMILGVVVNGGNSSLQARAQFKKDFKLSLNQLGLTANYTRFRADTSTLIGNSEKLWYGWNDNFNASRKKYLQHSAYARMRFQTSARQIAIEYVRDFYDKQVVNLFSLGQGQSSVDWNSSGQVVAGNQVINNYTHVTSGKTYTISGLLTTSPTYVWYSNGTPLSSPASLSNIGTAQSPVYAVTAPANATNLGLLVQRVSNPGSYTDPLNDSYTCYTSCMIQEGAVGVTTPSGGVVPSPYTPFSGYTASHISGPAIFINGKLYKYYQVEGNDLAKVIQFVTDTLPAGSKTVEVMMPGQGTYLPADPHVRRAGTFLRAVYISDTTTTVSSSSTVNPGSILYIHDSILSGYNISSNAQNNVWMMKTKTDPSFNFTGDVFSEGYAGRILYTDISTPELTSAFAIKLASFKLDKFWFQLGVNDYGNLIPLHLFYKQYKSLIEQLKVLRPDAKIFIQATGPESYEGPNGETYADDGLSTTGPAANDFRDVQRAIATSHSYTEYVNFENLFPASVENMADGIHPSDIGNALYADGVKNKSTLLGTVQPLTALSFYRNSSRKFIVNIPGIYTITASGGVAPYKYTLLSGTLPAGLSFNGDGTITGTASASGIFVLNVKVADANLSSLTKSISIEVSSSPNILVGPRQIINGQINKPYSKVFKARNGYGPYIYNASGLPVGMSFNSATGAMTGIPSSTGSSTIIVTATDHWGFTGSSSYNFNVGTGTPAPLTDIFSVTGAVTSANHLILTGHLNDIYSSTLFAYVAAYYTPTGGNEVFLSGNSVNVSAGSVDGLSVDAGAMGLPVGNFTIRLVTTIINPSALDNVNITYGSNVQSLSTANASPTELFTATPSISATGHLLVTAHIPTAHSQIIYSSVGAIVTQNGSSVFVSGPNTNINAGALNSAAVDIGQLNVVSGTYTVQLYIGAVTPTSIDGKVITYNSTSTVYRFTKP